VITAKSSRRDQQEADSPTPGGFADEDLEHLARG